MSDHAERLFEEALALEGDERRRFVEQACRDDPELGSELISLLDEVTEADAFFERLGDAVFSSSPSVENDDAAAEPPPTDLNEGDEVGHYRIASPIANGGMGAVYRARDTRLDRDVALKFLPPSSGGDVDAQNRLFAEARAVAALDHPNVCRIHEIGEADDGRLFLVMPCYDGETLKQRLRRGPLAPADAIATAIQIARGLSAAHARGIIHRDIKPGNIMLEPDGTARILDFGLAVAAQSGAGETGRTPGTVAYMSPEQLRGGHLDSRTDLWSLGVVLYGMLSGRKPFQGQTTHAIVFSILHSDPEPVGSFSPEIPHGLSGIVERLLAKAPMARYDSAAEALGDLEQSVRSSSSVSRTIPHRRYIAAGGVIALLALAAIYGWRRLPEESVERIARTSIAVLPFRSSSSDSVERALAAGITEEHVERVTPWFQYSYRVKLRGFADEVTMSRRYASRLRGRLG